jgi:hypothetical protein
MDELSRLLPERSKVQIGDLCDRAMAEWIEAYGY